MGRDQQYAGQDHWTCIRCGLCLEACPTYVLTRDEGLSARGRVAIVHALATAGSATPARGEQAAGQDGEPPEPTWREIARGGRALLDLCLMCRACEAVCPSGVPYGRMMGEVRAWLIPRRPRPGDGRMRGWLRRVFTRPYLTRLVLGQVKLAVRLRLADLIVRLSTPPEHHEHYLALLESLRVRLPVAGALERAAIPGAARGRPPAAAAAGAAPGAIPAGPAGKALIFRGCLAPVFFPAVIVALRSALAKLGVPHETPRRQVCCGALHRQHGLREEARALARRNIDAFEAEGEPLILAESSSCAAALLDYADLLSGDAEYAERARRFSARVRDASRFLADGLRNATATAPAGEGGAPAGESGAAVARPAGGGDPAAVLAQEPCHLRHGQRGAGCLSGALAALGLAQPDAAAEADLCCGGSGLYSLLEPGMSARLGERKADVLAAGGTGLVITSDCGCRLQLQGRLARRGVAMLHLAEVCDRLWQ